MAGTNPDWFRLIPSPLTHQLNPTPGAPRDTRPEQGRSTSAGAAVASGSEASAGFMELKKAEEQQLLRSSGAEPMMKPQDEDLAAHIYLRLRKPDDFTPDDLSELEQRCGGGLSRVLEWEERRWVASQ